MPRYTYGALSEPVDPFGFRRRVGAKTVVLADSYRIDSGYVTFIRDDKPFLSVPFSKAPVVAELDDNNDIPITFVE
ncbi:hypothetical protein KXD96_22795 [Mycobacterium sp. SMC-2]|uniref:hypothetical protein n=1 Tax=Mycobacterium sp. SMC-2 TaxID=2857058 RepID=UPI0021B42EEB|nr:hypothetical protein [Mycobacterium sp. SMC-2]UXA05705.1 hypothetical protein KXD96_22795 [Mycobacterium sp. SMC-2]